MQANLEIIMKPINEVIPYWRNPRRNDKTVDELVKTIPVAGFNVPIVIDKNGVVVKGHARLKAAKRLGMTEVPCVVSTASEDVIKADRIADNKIQELSSWDFGKLNLELENHSGRMQFERLFKPEESPISGEQEIPPINFKPISLNLDDVVDEDAPNGFSFVPQSGYGGYGDAHVAGNENFAEGQNKPEKRQLKTLCPYCGKVVVIDV